LDEVAENLSVSRVTRNVLKTVIFLRGRVRRFHSWQCVRISLLVVLVMICVKT